MDFQFKVSRSLVTTGPLTGEIRLVAKYKTEPIGIAVGVTHAGRPAQLGHIRVKEPYRRRRVASTLLKMLEREFVEHDCLQVEATVTRNTLPEGAAELLCAEGWQAFQVKGLLCSTDCDVLSKAGWINYRKLPFHASLFPWRELSPAERYSLCLAREQETYFPRDLDPLRDEAMIDHRSSFGLRLPSGVAGWCIFHRLAANTTRCASLFVRENLRNRGYALALAAHGIRSQGTGHDSRIFFDISHERVQMMRFFYRGLLPYIRGFAHIQRATKALGELRA